MRFRTYAGARPGISQIMQAIAAPGGNTYQDTMRDLSMVDANRSLAAERQGQARLHDQKYQSRTPSTVIDAIKNGVTMPEGMSPEAMGTLFLASENPDIRSFTQSLRDLGGTSGQRAAMSAAETGDVPKMNRIISALSEKPYEPYKLNDTGVLDAGTGDVRYTPGHEALARERDAGAAKQYAQGREADAQARAARYTNLSSGASLVDLLPGGQPPQSPITRALAGVGPEAIEAPGAPQPAGGPQIVATAPTDSAASGTNAQKVYRELLSLGAPEEVAMGTAYKTVRQVQDKYGNTALVDLGTGQVIGTLKKDAKGMPYWEPAAKAGSPNTYQHPVYGAITDDDIAETARQNGMTIEQVKQKLGL